LNGGNPDAPAQAFLDQWKAKYEGGSVPNAGVASVSPSGGSSGDGVPVAAGNPAISNPMGAALGQQQMLGSIFTDALAPLAKPPIDPASLVRKPKSVGNIIGELGAPVQLSA
jgi:hypothetical protein